MDKNYNRYWKNGKHHYLLITDDIYFDSDNPCPKYSITILTNNSWLRDKLIKYCRENNLELSHDNYAPVLVGPTTLEQQEKILKYWEDNYKDSKEYDED